MPGGVTQQEAVVWKWAEMSRNCRNGGNEQKWSGAPFSLQGSADIFGLFWELADLWGLLEIPARTGQEMNSRTISRYKFLSFWQVFVDEMSPQGLQSKHKSSTFATFKISGAPTRWVWGLRIHHSDANSYARAQMKLDSSPEAALSFHQSFVGRVCVRQLLRMAKRLISDCGHSASFLQIPWISLI